MKCLFEPGKIGNCQIRNRVVMPPMTTGFAGLDGQPTDQMVAFYEERAKGGVGLIVSEIFCIDPESGVSFPRQLSTINPMNISSIARMVAKVQSHGAKMFAQIHHGGSTNDPALNNGTIYSASDVPNLIGVPPTPLTIDQIHHIQEEFISTAVSCKLAGFDGVELHAAHGYLIAEFFSGNTNVRTDEYGGSLENRCRFATEIIAGIKAACGKDYPVTARLSAGEFDPMHENSITLEESVEIAKILEAAGLDALDLSVCNQFSSETAIEPYSYAQGWRKDNAKAIKDAVSIPVISTSTIKQPEFAEKLLEEGYCDFVGIGRGNLADPEWSIKAREGRSDEIHKCIGCLHCFESLLGKAFLNCSVNPRLGYECAFPAELPEDGDGRKVVVVGGGPGGMEAAVILGRRGFDVTLFEKNAELGGAMYQASITAPYKEKIGWFIDTLKKEMELAGVDVRLNTCVTPEDVKALEPEAVFLACGGNPVKPPFPGIDGANVVLAEDVIRGKVQPSGNIAVIGGGLTGLETAECICNHCPDVKVSIVDMLPQLGVGMYPIVFMDVMKQLEPFAPNIMTGHALKEITDGCVKMTKVETGEDVELAADCVVLAMGVKPDKGVAAEFGKAFSKVYVIGEAKEAPGRIAYSMRDGYRAAVGYDPRF